MTYAEQIKSPKWQKKRLKILERDKYTCQSCGEENKTLHVHHLLYKKGNSIWEYKDHELTTLCEECHEEITRLFENIKLNLQPRLFTTDHAFVYSNIIEMISRMSLADVIEIKYIIESIFRISIIYTQGREDKKPEEHHE
jgi:hypothetical protein